MTGRSSARGVEAVSTPDYSLIFVASSVVLAELGRLAGVRFGASQCAQPVVSGRPSD